MYVFKSPRSLFTMNFANSPFAQQSFPTFLCSLCSVRVQFPENSFSFSEGSFGYFSITALPEFYSNSFPFVGNIIFIPYPLALKLSICVAYLVTILLPLSWEFSIKLHCIYLRFEHLKTIISLRF